MVDKGHARKFEKPIRLREELRCWQRDFERLFVRLSRARARLSERIKNAISLFRTWREQQIRNQRDYDDSVSRNRRFVAKPATREAAND